MSEMDSISELLKVGEKYGLTVELVWSMTGHYANSSRMLSVEERYAEAIAYAYTEWDVYPEEPQ